VKKKSILFISGYYYPSQLGGPCNSNHWLVNALKSNNFYVMVLATSAGISVGQVKFNNWIHDKNGKVIYLKTKWPNFSITFILKYLKELRNVDLVQISSLFSFSSFIIALLSILYGKPVVWSPRGELAAPALKRNFVLKNLFIKIIGLFTRKIHFHVTGKDELKDLQGAFGCDVKYILHPNYIQMPYNLVVQRKKQFIYVGRLHPIKSLDKLITGLFISKYFIKENYNFLIIGSGDGNYEKYLRILIDNYKLTRNVLFLDHISDVNQKNRLFSESLFSFLVSESENFGNVILESISNGTPVVSSKGTPWNILEEKSAGFWISNEPHVIANCIDQIIKMDSKVFNEYSARALDLAKDYDIKNNIDKWVLSYNSIIK
jgi:glycosyltransferase involved in cell wall biosynthesis